MRGKIVEGESVRKIEKKRKKEERKVKDEKGV